MTNTKCCSQNMGGYCPSHSKYKMVFLMKYAFKRKNNPTYYNFLSDNTKSFDAILNGMLKRLEKKHRGEYTFIEVYDVITGEKLKRITP